MTTKRDEWDIAKPIVTAFVDKHMSAYFNAVDLFEVAATAAKAGWDARDGEVQKLEFEMNVSQANWQAACHDIEEYLGEKFAFAVRALEQAHKDIHNSCCTMHGDAPDCQACIDASRALARIAGEETP